MSKFGQELVWRAPPVSMRTLESLGTTVRDTIGLSDDDGLCPIDWGPLVDRVLPKMSINVYEVDPWELGGDEGATEVQDDGTVAILLPHVTYASLFSSPSRRSNRARATMPHELSHAVIHAPVVRQYRRLPQAQSLLRREARSGMKTYEDAEWQAWALAGCIVAPRHLVLTQLALLRTSGPGAIALLCGVSEVFMTQHLRRLKLVPPAEGARPRW